MNIEDMGWTYGFSIGETKEEAIESDFIYSDYEDCYEDLEQERRFHPNVKMWKIKMYYDPQEFQENS